MPTRKGRKGTLRLETAGKPCKRYISKPVKMDHPLLLMPVWLFL
jgi:hypothetical protein